MEGGRVHEMNKAEIDTRAPFRSVKEAVMLFGDRVLASEVYGSRLKEMHERFAVTKYTNETLGELEEAKQRLQKAQEESMQMATTLFFLQQELERTKIELQQLKTRESLHPNNELQRRHHQLGFDLDLSEDIKFVEEDTRIARVRLGNDPRRMISDLDYNGFDSKRKKYVRFSNPPCVAQVDLPNHAFGVEDGIVIQRQTSLKKNKRKQFIEFIKGVFSKKIGRSEVVHA